MGGVALVAAGTKRMVTGGEVLRKDGGDAPRQDPFHIII
jgi:hypothetical protein